METGVALLHAGLRLVQPILERLGARLKVLHLRLKVLEPKKSNVIFHTHFIANGIIFDQMDIVSDN